MENRTPNESIRRRLRKEVNYGCPICRSPFLAYHHFDPPWEPNHTHNVEGMIALCPTHHAQADVGTWTIEELRCLKKESNNKSINGQIHWSLHNSIIVAGSNLFLGRNITFRVLGKEIFKLREIKPNIVVLNALLFSEKNQPILQIIEDDIILAPDLVEDFNCTASANRIRVDVKASNSFLEISYSRKNLDYIVELLDQELKDDKDVISIIQEKLIDGMISIIDIKFRINTDKFNIECRVPDIIFDFRKYGYDRAKFNGRFFGINGSLRIVTSVAQRKIESELIFLGHSRS